MEYKHCILGDDHEGNANEVDIGQDLQVEENDMNQPVEHHEEERLLKEEEQ